MLRPGILVEGDLDMKEWKMSEMRDKVGRGQSECPFNIVLLYR
jgi:hypothetical protein